MPHLHSRTTATVVAIVAVVAVQALAGCGTDPNGEDRERLDTVRDDPLLQVAPPGMTVDDAVATRAQLTTGGGMEGKPSVAWAMYYLEPDPRTQLQPFIDHLLSNGWRNVHLDCNEREPQLQLYAVRPSDGYNITARLTFVGQGVSAAADVPVEPLPTQAQLDVRVEAPFHDSDGPEMTDAPPDVACLDQLN